MRVAALLAVMTTALVRGQSADPVTAEFRVFDGTTEISASTRLRVMPTGRRDSVISVDAGHHLATALAPGIYDVQALRLRQESIAAIRWAERLVIMRYPDEGGRHLEVINFQPGYGALQLRAGDEDVQAYEIAVFAQGDRGAPVASAIPGEGYRLFVVPAGRYDLRVRHTEAPEDSEDVHWFLDFEVPANRTRLKNVTVR
jgi:hypothetical protein